MITYLTPLIVKEVFQNERTGGSDDNRWGWAVEGSPADCVKIGVHEFCPRRPDLVVSGINAGLNAGINVLYSGTVAAAIEAPFSALPASPSPCSLNAASSSTGPLASPGRSSSRSWSPRDHHRSFTTSTFPPRRFPANRGYVSCP